MMANAKQRRQIKRAAAALRKAGTGKIPALPAPPMVQRKGKLRPRGRRPNPRPKTKRSAGGNPTQTVVHVQPREVPWWETALNVVGGIGHALIPLISGAGDYTVKSNSLMAAGSAGKLGGVVPRLSNTATHNVISHREYLGDILSTTNDFVTQYYSINPGLITSFPWVAPIANSYQQYRIKGMVFEFKTLATDYSAEPYIGYVAMATQYDSYDPQFNSKLALDNCEYSSSRRTNESFLHPIECARDQTTATELYVRNGTITQGDQRLYDWGQFCIAVGGQASGGVTIGELWVTYEIEFFKPKLATEIGYNSLSAEFSSTLGITNANPLGTNGSSTGSIPITNISSTSFTLGVQDGIFYVFAMWTGTAAACALPTLSVQNGAVTNIAFAPDNAVSSGHLIGGWLVISKPSSGAFPILSWSSAGTLPSSAVACSMWISQKAQISYTDGPVVSRMRARGNKNEKDRCDDSVDSDDDDLNLELQALMQENLSLRDEIESIKKMLSRLPMWSSLVNGKCS